MGMFDNISKKAREATEAAKAAAESAAETTKQKAKAAADATADMGISLGSGFSKACDYTSARFSSAKTSVVDFIYDKIHQTVRGMNLDETIDAINKAGKERNVDVSVLVKFVEQINKIGDDDKK